MKSLISTILCLPVCIALAGCVTDDVGTNVGTTITDVGSLLNSTDVLNKSQINSIIDKVKQTCQFAPTAETIVSLASVFSSSVATTASIATPIVSSICNVADNVPTQKLSVSRLKAPKVIGTVDGVPITGTFTNQ